MKLLRALGHLAATASATLLAGAAVLGAPAAAQAADQDPVYTCQFVLVDDINRVAGADCTGGPADYEGPGTIKQAGDEDGWQCAQLGSGKDEEHPGRLIVVGVLGCERAGEGEVSE
ncbi:hypothetical protein [Kitasatospora sp. NPDC058218]|uniref:hypothetical protein n=1 Tax=Kitasatospora sp. NPDC058218 TaxID=3346385 RepID=UPI0036D7F556